MRRSPMLSMVISGLFYTQRKRGFFNGRSKDLFDGYSDISKNSGLPGKTRH